MSFLRRASATEVTRIETPDGTDWIELKAEFSKGEMNKLMLSAPKSQEDVEQGLGFIKSYARSAISDWSLCDEEGNKIPFSPEEYDLLATEAANWIDGELGKHLQRVMGKRVAELEGKQ